MKTEGVELIVNLDDHPIVEEVTKSEEGGSDQTVFIDHETRYAGLTRELKLGKVLQEMKDQKVSALYVNMLEEISWLLNVKATGQHEFDPMFNSALLIVSVEEPELFLFIQDDQLAKAQTFFGTLKTAGLTVLAYSELG